MLPHNISRHLTVVSSDQAGSTLHLDKRRLTPYQIAAIEEAEAAVHATAKDVFHKQQRINAHDLGSSTSTADGIATAPTASSTSATTATSSQAPAASFVASSTAVGTGPSGSSPDGTAINHGKDRRSESAFYRNATYTRGTPNITAPPPFVLQEVPLTPFDGDIREYPRFRDRFLDIMEAQPNLEPRHKLMHLLRYLRGEPLRTADRFRLSDDNYFIVTDHLEKRYGDKASYHNVLIRDLAALPELTSTMLSDVTRFYDDTFQLITDLGQFAKADSSIVLGLLMGKIPEKLREYLVLETSYANDQTVDGLLHALDHLVWRGRQAIHCGLNLYREPATDIDLVPPIIFPDDDASSEHTIRETSLEQPIHGSQQASSESAEDRAAVAVNASAEPRLKERQTCPLCGLLHTAFKCTIFTNINARLRRIMKLKLCLVCLRQGHQAATCPRKTTDFCKICHKGPHNRAVCMTANSRTRERSRRRSHACNTGSTVDRKRSDQQRHTQKHSVTWVDGKSTSTATKLRQSETQSSSVSTPKTNRKNKWKKLRAVSSGRDGTSRPPTNSTAESMKQKTPDACGDSRLLPAGRGLKPTDRCSNNDESTQFYQAVEADGTDNSDAAADRHELRVEEDTSSESSGDYSDYSSSTSENPPDSTPLQTDAIYCASSTTEPTTLLECIKATAENPTTGDSMEVLIFFDSGSNRSFVTTELARVLSLPRDRPCSFRAHTFGSMLPSTVEGFSTSIVLRSTHRRLQSLAITAGDCIVPSVRTALVEQKDLPKLRRNELSPSPIRVTPDILIGQDLVSRFKRRYGSTLPHGFYVVHSILGPMLGGSGNVPKPVPVAAISSDAATSPSVVHRSVTLTDGTLPSLPLPPNTHRTPLTTHSVEKGTDFASKPITDTDASADTACQDFFPSIAKHVVPRSKTSTSYCTERHILSSSSERPSTCRKQPNPLDTTAPLPPTNTLVTLHQGPRTDPGVLTPYCNVPDRRPRICLQQNSALTKPRKTRLRRCSTSIGSRSLLGIKNHEELRIRETTRNPLDAVRSKIAASTCAVPDTLDPNAHSADSTLSEGPLPDVVFVAAEVPSKNSGPEPTIGPNTTTRPHPGQRFPSASARSHSDQRFPSPSKGINHVPRSQHRLNRQPKPILRGNETHGKPSKDVSLDNGVRTTRSDTTRNQKTNDAAKTPRRKQIHPKAKTPQAIREGNAPKTAHGQTSRTPTGSNQHSTAATRQVTTHAQVHRKSCIARQDARVTTTDREATSISEHALYQLNNDLPNRAITACEGRNESRGPHFIKDLSARLHLSSGAARRADHADQGILTPFSSSAQPTTHSVVPPTASLRHAEPVATCRMCAFCGGHHFSTECELYHNINHRMQRLQASKRCFLCLEQGHQSSMCPKRTMSSCHHCHDGRHHLALCRSFLEGVAATAPATLPTAAIPSTIVAPGTTQADHADQGILTPLNSSAYTTTHSVAPAASSPPHVVTKPTRRMCAFCNSQHHPTECSLFPGVKLRLRRLGKLKRCFVCLNDGHSSEDCPERTADPCRHCRQGHHHPALCRMLQQSEADAYATHPAARQAGPIRRTTAIGTFPAVMNNFRRVEHLPATKATTATGTFPAVMEHFRRDDQQPTTKPDSRVTSLSAKPRSAAVKPPAQAPSTQPSRPRPKRTVASLPGKEHQVQAPTAAKQIGTDPTKPTRTSNRHHNRQKKSSSKMTHSVKTETHTTLVEQTEPSSSNEKIDHPRPTEVVARVEQPMEATPTEPFSTLLVVRAEASHQSLTSHSGEADSRTDGPTPPPSITVPSGNDVRQHTKAKNRRALQRQNRTSSEVVARDEKPTRAQLTEPFSTLVVVPAEASHQSVTPHSGEAGSRTDGPTPPPTISGSFGPELPSNVIQQTAMAEDRRALPRQNRESKK